MVVFQLQATVGGGEASVGAEMCECRHQTLIYVECRELVKFLQEIGALRHNLRQ